MRDNETIPPPADGEAPKNGSEHIFAAIVRQVIVGELEVLAGQLAPIERHVSGISEHVRVLSQELRSRLRTQELEIDEIKSEMLVLDHRLKILEERKCSHEND